MMEDDCPFRLMEKGSTSGRIRSRGVTAGEEPVREVADFHTRVFLCEYDYLDGILYPERMAGLKN